MNFTLAQLIEGYKGGLSLAKLSKNYRVSIPAVRKILVDNGVELRSPQSAGGKTVSKNREHMAAIGRKGGLKTSEDKDHMRMISKSRKK